MSQIYLFSKREPTSGDLSQYLRIEQSSLIMLGSFTFDTFAKQSFLSPYDRALNTQKPLTDRRLLR